MTDPDELPAGEEWRRRPGVMRQGLRFGSIGCVGCLTFIVLGFLLLVVIIALAAHHH